MKRLILTSLVVCAAASAAPRAQSGDAARADVLAAQKKFYEAYRDCNLKELGRIVTDDMFYLHSTGSLQNKADFIKGVSTCTLEELTLTVKHVRFYGDTAVLVGDIHYKPKGAPAGAPMVASEVFVKRNGQWLFAMHQTTEPVPAGTSLKIKK